jgi:heat shock protein HtpX
MNHDVLQKHALINRFQSLLLLGFMAAFLALLGSILWGGDGVFLLLILGIVVVLLNPALSPRLILNMYRASRLSPQQAPVLYSALEELARRAELPDLPWIYYVPSRTINAFAVGDRRNAAIALSDGLIRRLGTREIIAVLAHEISHIQHNDMWVMGIADLFTRLTNLLSLLGQFLLLLNLPLLVLSDYTINWFAILLLIFAPSLSALMQLALSRTREYDADLNAARLTGDPAGLASALAKIEQYQGRFFERVFLPGRRVPDPSLLRTHPPTEERIRRLMALQIPTRRGSTFYEPGSDQFVDRISSSPVVRHSPRWHISGLWH